MADDPTWPGTRTNFVLIDGVLEAQSADTWDTLPTTWDAWTLWASNPAASASYIAAPTAMRMAVPEANAALSITASSIRTSRLSSSSPAASRCVIAASKLA